MTAGAEEREQPSHQPPAPLRDVTAPAPSPTRAATSPGTPPPAAGRIPGVPVGARRPTSINERRRAQQHQRTSTRQSSRSLAAQMAADRLRQDRWGWRRKIRRSPRKLAFYRAVVGVIGTFFICLGFITGPLPGPGGIPLVLLGLAIWASEFHWAHRVMVWFKLRLKQYQSWSRKQQVQFWAVFALCCWLLAWAYLAVIGPPGWLPTVLQNAVALLPGV